MFSILVFFKAYLLLENKSIYVHITSSHVQKKICQYMNLLYIDWGVTRNICVSCRIKAPRQTEFILNANFFFSGFKTRHA